MSNMNMPGMDMSGWTCRDDMPGPRMGGRLPALRNVGGDDDRHDGALRCSDGLAFLGVNQRRQAAGRRSCQSAFCRRVPRGLDSVLRHAGPVVVAQDRTPIAHNGGDQSGFERRAALRGGRLPMDST